MEKIKPLLAVNAELEKIKFPVLVSPKLDGIRVLMKDGKALSRTLKPIPNKFLQQTLAKFPVLQGLDGEMVVGSPTDKNCMQNTSSGVMSMEGQPDFKYYVFDYWTSPEVPFKERLEHLSKWDVQGMFRQMEGRVVLLQHIFVHNEQELLELEEQYLSQGYEGLMVRSLEGRYKYGRSTVREGILLKVKRFKDSEAEIIGVEELMHNDNVATLDNLGNTARSSHKDGLVAGDTLGALVVRDLETGIEFKIGTGFTAEVRQEFWDNHKRGNLVGRIAKYKHFEVGVKEAPRFPVFLGFRDPTDM